MAVGAFVLQVFRWKAVWYARAAVAVARPDASTKAQTNAARGPRNLAVDIQLTPRSKRSTKIPPDVEPS